MNTFGKVGTLVCLGVSIGLVCGQHAIARSPSPSSSELVDKLCPLEPGDEDGDEIVFERIMACSQKLSLERRVNESISLAEQGLAIALKQSGEMSEDYAYALKIHAIAIALTGAAKQAAQELKRAEEIEAALNSN